MTPDMGPTSVPPASDDEEAGAQPQPDIYSAFLGGLPTDSDHLQALAAQLRRQNTLGQIFQSTGDRAIAPLGAGMVEQTGSELQDTGRLKQAMAQLQATQAYRQAELGQGQQRLAQQANEDNLNRQNMQQMHAEQLANQRLIAGVLPDGPGGGAQPGSDLHGDDFLGTLPAGLAAQVKAVAEGREQVSPTTIRSPQGRQLMNALGQYDPNFDLVNYNARSKTRGDFTSGPSAKALASINMGIQHMGELLDAAPEVAGSQVPLVGHGLNATMNWLAQQSGKPGITDYEAKQSTVGTEVPRALRGAGIAEADIDRFMPLMSPNNSLEQKQSGLRGLAQLLQDRLGVMRGQYNTGMGTTDQPLPIINAQSQATLQRLLGSAGSESGSADPMEGRTATGPNGQRVVRKGGQWVPM